MSHFDTLKNLKLIALFVLLVHPCADAKIKCEILFNPKPGFTEKLKGLFTRKAQLTLSDEQALELKEFLASDLNIKPYGMGRGTHDPLFIYIWGLIPHPKKLALIYLFENTPQEFKKYRNVITELLSEHQLDSSASATFLELLFSNWGEHLNGDTAKLNFTDWISQLEVKYNQRLNAGEFRIQDLKKKFEQGVQYKNAGTFWQNVYGVHEVPTKMDNSQYLVNINGTWLKAQINKANKSIRILTPRQMIGRAAWNPIYSEVLRAKIANGHRQLSEYPAFLATNGTFYLSDGNHRFMLDTRTEVWLEMSYPAKTSSMSISFDAIGLSQPSIEKQLSLMNKEITLEELIGEELAAKLIYR